MRRSFRLSHLRERLTVVVTQHLQRHLHALDAVGIVLLGSQESCVLLGPDLSHLLIGLGDAGQLTLKVGNLLLQGRNPGFCLVDLGRQTLDFRLFVLFLVGALLGLRLAEFVLRSLLLCLGFKLLDHFGNETLHFGEGVSRGRQSCPDSHRKRGQRLVTSFLPDCADLSQRTMEIVRHRLGVHLKESIRLVLRTTSFFLDDLSCSVQRFNLLCSLVHGHIPLFSSLFTVVMGLSITLDVLVQLLLCGLQVALRGCFHLSLCRQTLSGSIELLVVKSDLICQRLLHLLILEARRHLGLICFCFLRFGLVEHVPQQIQNAAGPVVGFVSGRFGGLSQGILRLLVRLQES
mmetsp:Transcript_38590/g.94668  ORF Transcript_38590/g.94668 Transcript_38590/m.94668 type:complete len:347 (-) Transcript_38590:614-1654(-)